MKLLIPILGILTLTLSLADCTQEYKPGNPCRPEGRRTKKGPRPTMMFGHTERFEQEYGLSQKQIQLIQTINERYRKEHAKLYREFNPMKRELHTLLIQENMDFDKIEKQLIKMSLFDVKRQLYFIKHRTELEKVLTEKQRQKMRRNDKVIQAGPFMLGK